jgi:hypothetical protein
VSLLEVYWRALGYLGAEKRKVFLICAANVALAMIAIAEPVLFGRVIDAISGKADVVPTSSAGSSCARRRKASQRRAQLPQCFRRTSATRSTTSPCCRATTASAMRPQRCAAMSRDLLKAQNPVLDWWALASALHRLASTISMMVVLLIGAYLVMRGELKVGNIDRLHRLRLAADFAARPDLGLREPDFRGARQADRVLQARGRLPLTAGAGRPARAGGVTGHIRFENVGFVPEQHAGRRGHFLRRAPARRSQSSARPAPARRR